MRLSTMLGPIAVVAVFLIILIAGIAPPPEPLNWTDQQAGCMLVILPVDDQVPDLTPSDVMLEVCLCIDTTGSMYELNRVLWSVQDVLELLDDDPASPLLRYALVLYRDDGLEYVTMVHDLMSGAELNALLWDVFDWYAPLTEDNDDYPEAVAEALHTAVHEVSWTEGAGQAIVLIGDAPPHAVQQGGPDPIACAREAAALGIEVHVLGMPGISGHEGAFWEVVNATGGTFTYYADYWPMPNSTTGEMYWWEYGNASRPPGEADHYGLEEEWSAAVPPTDDDGQEQVEQPEGQGQGQGQGDGQGQGQGNGQGQGQGQQGPTNVRMVLLRCIRDLGRSAGVPYEVHILEVEIDIMP